MSLVYEIAERSARVFPRSSFFTSDGRSLVLPEARNLGALDLRDVADGVQVRALGLVGLFPVTTQISLHIAPKFPIANLWRMLSVADSSFRHLLVDERRYAADETGTPTPDKVVSGAFFKYLAQILESGIFRGYRQVEHRGSYVPRIDFAGTFSRYSSRGDSLNTVCQVALRTKDLLVNQLLLGACLAFRRLATTASEKRLVETALEILGGLTPARTQFNSTQLANEVPTWLQRPYSGALFCYELVSGLRSISFSIENGAANLPSFLFSLDEIFESFIRESLRSPLQKNGFLVIDGNKPGRKPLKLFTDNEVYPVKPDVFVKLDGRSMLVAEVKYKPKLEESDRYQLICHSLALGAPIAVWVSPAQGDNGGVAYVGDFGGLLRCYHYRFDLSKDVDSESARMVKSIGELLAGI